MSGVRVHVDPKVCTGAQLCLLTAPDVFAYDDAILATRAVEETVDDGEAALAAAEGCPVEAITVTDAGTGATLFP